MYAEDQDEFVLRYDVEPGVRISTAVAEATAIASRSAVSDLPPLTEAVDPDALDALSEAVGFGSFSFSYNGYQVTIDGVDAVILTRGDADGGIPG
ncbi:HalOD1 output domain-containing protein [Halomarina halobia]|uniref:HalOD1 output domain-containing protein n=1 Tax=Halomarina halobia TaxID=3033386 RepID=A0ABD6A820_9EURY|nr:HalOD1 output domain-containing protein [Halomarina sp. PSR21]